MAPDEPPAGAGPAAVGDAAAAADAIQVTVLHAAAPHQVHAVALQLPAGATAADALQASGLPQRLGAAQMRPLRLALWDRLCDGAAPLHDGDRLVLLRPLTVDPMEARRRRHQRDGLQPPKRRSPRQR